MNPRQSMLAVTMAALLPGLAFQPEANAFNTQFLDDAPIARFNKKDIEIWLDTLTKTLDSGEDGVEVKWENPKTGHKGTITPMNRKTHEGMDCRDVDIRNVAGSSSSADELAKLADLRDKGVISEEEFAAQKAKILAG